MLYDSEYVPTQTETEKDTDLEKYIDTDDDLFIEYDDKIFHETILSSGSNHFFHRIRSNSFDIHSSEITDDDNNDDDNNSVHTIESHSNLIEKLSENEITDIFTDINEDIYRQIDDYYDKNILKLSSPNFYTDMFNSITEILYTEWYYAGLCDDNTYEDLLELVEQIFISHSVFSEIPKRMTTSIENNNINKKEIKSKIRELQNIPQPKQRTQEWYEFRNELLTASNIWKVFGTEAQVNSIIYEKCKPNDNNINYFTNTESSLHWGVKYEQVSTMIYEKIFQTKLGEFGCFKHKNYPFIGASPDGINIDENNKRYGRMVEIKNIFNREITGIPKSEYWIQTQIQMEVCDLDECDFVETRFCEYKDENSFYNDKEKDYKGVILHFVQRTSMQEMNTSVNNSPVYKYMPIFDEINKKMVEDWIVSMKVVFKKENLVLFSTIYWYLDEISCVLIERNRKWFQEALPIIENVWNTITKERTNSDVYIHRAPKKRLIGGNTTNGENNSKKISVSSDLSNSYVIKNMPITNSICLIKLDE